MELIKLTKSQKENLQKLLNAFYQGNKISEVRGSDYYSYSYAVESGLKYSSKEYNAYFKLNVKAWKSLRQFFTIEGSIIRPGDVTNLNNERLLMVDGIGDMIKNAIEIKQNIHKAELKLYDEQIGLLNNIIAKYQLWNHDVKVVSYRELCSRNFFHGLFSKEDRNQLESLNSVLAGKRVEVQLG